MDKNIRINGIDYKGIDTIKVKDAVSEELHAFRNTDDANIESKDIPIGKVGYGKDGKVFGTYIPPSTVGSGKTDYEDGINFYDQYGQKIASYRLEDLPLSALPEIPALEGAGADQYEFAWSMTLEEVNALTEEADIGVDVTAKEGAKTYIIPTERGFSTTQLALNRLYFYGGDETSTISIDWGDGTTSSLTIGANARKDSYHIFKEVSHNPISIEKVSGGDFYLGGVGTGTANTGYAFLYYSTQNLSDCICCRTKEVRVGKGIKGLCSYTCYYSTIEKIILPNSITETVGVYTIFQSCYFLKSINMPKSIKTITGLIVDNGIRLETVYLHEGLESSVAIVERCPLVKRIRFPKTYNSFIGTRFGMSNQNLLQIILPEHKISCKSGFSGISTDNREIIDWSNFECDALGDGFSGSSKSAKEIKLPIGIKSIGNNFLSSCWSIRSIEIPEGVETIGTNFAQDCSGLDIVILPSTIQSIGSSFLSSSYSYAPKSIVVKSITPPTLLGTIPKGIIPPTIYVPKGSLESYITATNWTAMAEQMVEY